MVMVNVSSSKELDKIVRGSGSTLVVVKFFATWCGACTYMSETFSRLEQENPDVYFLNVDVDENQQAATVHKINSMPTFKFYKNKHLLHVFTGADTEQLKQSIIQLK